ncbi:MAG: hypothetical protein V3T17_09235, partial [Pseudomonadales bacterium]
GRHLITELLDIVSYMQEAIISGTPSYRIRRKQILEGTFKDMWSDGFRIIAKGKTTFEELENHLPAYAEDRSQSNNFMEVDSKVDPHFPQLQSENVQL